MPLCFHHSQLKVVPTLAASVKTLNENLSKLTKYKPTKFTTED